MRDSHGIEHDVAFQYPRQPNSWRGARIEGDFGLEWLQNGENHTKSRHLPSPPVHRPRPPQMPRRRQKSNEAVAGDGCLFK